VKKGRARVMNHHSGVAISTKKFSWCNYFGAAQKFVCRDYEWFHP